MLSIECDNLQLYPNFALFTTLRGGLWSSTTIFFTLANQLKTKKKTPSPKLEDWRVFGPEIKWRPKHKVLRSTSAQMQTIVKLLEKCSQIIGGIYPPRGAETRGDGEIYPPIIWPYPPNSLKWCTSERKFGEKVFYSCWRRPFSFFFVFTWIWGKKVFYFWWRLFYFRLHLNFGKKLFYFNADLFFLVFTKFPLRNKIVVEVHLPQCWK